MLPRSPESFGLQCSRFSSNQQEKLHWNGLDGCAYQRGTFSDSVKIGELLKNCSCSQAKWPAIRNTFVDCEVGSLTRKVKRLNKMSELQFGLHPANPCNSGN